jgi:hypothetical protein
MAPLGTARGQDTTCTRLPLFPQPHPPTYPPPYLPTSPPIGADRRTCRMRLSSAAVRKLMGGCLAPASASESTLGAVRTPRPLGSVGAAAGVAGDAAGVQGPAGEGSAGIGHSGGAVCEEAASLLPLLVSPSLETRTRPFLDAFRFFAGRCSRLLRSRESAAKLMGWPPLSISIPCSLPPSVPLVTPLRDRRVFGGLGGGPPSPDIADIEEAL